MVNGRVLDNETNRNGSTKYAKCPNTLPQIRLPSWRRSGHQGRDEEDGNCPRVYLSEGRRTRESGVRSEVQYAGKENFPIRKAFSKAGGEGVRDVAAGSQRCIASLLVSGAFGNRHAASPLPSAVSVSFADGLHVARQNLAMYLGTMSPVPRNVAGSFDSFIMGRRESRQMCKSVYSIYRHLDEV